MVDKQRHSDGTKTINGFLVGQELGSGSFAKVKICTEEETGKQYAIKIFRKGRLRRQREFVGGGDGSGMKVQSSLDKVHNEVKIMRAISHPNCIQLYAVFDDDDIDGKMYAVIEYAGRGTSMEWNNDKRRFMIPSMDTVFHETEVRKLMSDLLHALAYLHGSSVAHRDVKPQNVLIDNSGLAKLCDFGVAIRLNDDFRVCGTQGTYQFYSPEMCKPGYVNHDGRLSDVWALGVTFWAFLFGTVPFYHVDLVRLLESIGEGQYEIPDCTSVSAETCAFLRKLLGVEAETRPLCPELLGNTWLKG